MREDYIGHIFNSWYVRELLKSDKDNSIYQCECRDCGFTHAVSKANLSSIPCPTCPSKPKSKTRAPMADIVDMLGPLLGLDDNRRKNMTDAFDKLNQPEFKDVYSSLERASVSIKDVMSGKSGAPDVARKILEMETSNLKDSFNKLIKDGKITEEEARILKTDINSSDNIHKLKSMLEVMKQQTSETKKTKV